MEEGGVARQGGKRGVGVGVGRLTDSNTKSRWRSERWG